MIVDFHVYSENVNEIKNMNKSFFFSKGAKVHFPTKGKKIAKRFLKKVLMVGFQKCILEQLLQG